MSGHLSTLKLHQLRYGELEEEAEAAAKAHVSNCERCRSRLNAQENHRAAFELRPVPEAIKKADEPKVIRPRFPVWGGVVLAMAAAILLFLRSGSPVPTERIKGTQLQTAAWVEDASGAHPIEPGESVHTGDRIQLKFRRPPHQQVALAGVDGQGSVELYGHWLAEQEASEWQLAPFALRLDDVPGDVQLVLVFSTEQLGERAVRAAVDGKPGEDVFVRRVLLDKEP